MRPLPKSIKLVDCSLNGGMGSRMSSTEKWVASGFGVEIIS